MKTYDELLSEISDLRKRVAELEAENAILKGVDTPVPAPSIQVKESSQPQSMSGIERDRELEKRVALFRSIFRGRDDVFALRWQSKNTGKGGYSPVCENEWVQGLCGKPETKCKDCPSKKYVPLTDKYIWKHLEGKDELGRDVVGIYPILKDGTVYFLCCDFDDKSSVHGYKEDVLAYYSVCKEWGVPAYIERSRSGKGAHVWVFFQEPVPAAKARKLGGAILTEATRNNPGIDFKAYDRFLPNQDYVSGDDGLGNLIALPLQGLSRRLYGNSVFVDENFAVIEDRWKMLGQIRKMTPSELDGILSSRVGDGELGLMSSSSETHPWETPKTVSISGADFRNEVTIVKSNMLYVPVRGVSAKALDFIKRIATFKNPEYYRRQALRQSLFTTPRLICRAEVESGYVATPRGCEDALENLLTENMVPFTIEDRTNHGRKIAAKFSGKLRSEQADALNGLLQYDCGVLCATTAFGKTVVAASLIAARGVNTLVIVNTKTLQDQWKATLGDFLCGEDLSIGTIGGGRSKPSGCIDIAMMQSLYGREDGKESDDVKPIVRDYGMVIVDECHHIPAFKFESVLKFANARYVYGLTATPVRRDGHQPILFMQLGPIRYRSDSKAKSSAPGFDRILVPRFTRSRILLEDSRTDMSTLYKVLSEDVSRNGMILSDVRKSLSEGRTPIILCNRKSHVESLSVELGGFCPNVVTLMGVSSVKEKRQAIERLKSIPEDESMAIVATGKYVGEGFDYPRLDTLFLAAPISWKGILEQYAGRLHRRYDGKKEVRIYDYVDIGIPVCGSMYARRLKGYAAIGYSIRPDTALEIPDADVVMDGKSYMITMASDIDNARDSVLISCSKVNVYRYSKLPDALKDAFSRGGIHTE